MAILRTFQGVKNPDYPVDPVANTNGVKFTREYMIVYAKDDTISKTRKEKRPTT